MISLMPEGVKASSIKVELLEPNSGTIEVLESRIRPTRNYSLASYAVHKSFAEMKEKFEAQYDELEGQKYH